MPFLEEDGTLSRRVLTASCSGSPILLLSSPNPQVPLSKHQPFQEPVPGTPGGCKTQTAAGPPYGSRHTVVTYQPADPTHAGASILDFFHHWTPENTKSSFLALL